MKYAHTNIIAKDWRRLAEFYTKVFNCTFSPPERDLSGDWLDKGTGLKNASLKGCHLLLPGHGDQGPTLEIFTYEEIESNPPIAANHQGYVHIAFEVEDIESVYQLAIQHEAKELGEISEKSFEGRGTLKFVYFRDPEGNMIEILSWT